MKKQKKYMDSKINKFWDWFLVNEHFLKPELITNILVDNIDEKIQELGNFSWEIGYDDEKKDNFLVISPNGSYELLDECKYIINISPKIKNWYFLYSRPPKKWNLIFNLEINGNKLFFDAKEWEFLLFKYPDGVYDIVINFNNNEKIIKKIFYDAAIIALEGELGEEFVIEKINKIEIVNQFKKDEISKINQFSNLKLIINR